MMSEDGVDDKKFNLPEMEAVFKRLQKKIRKHVPEDIIYRCISLLTQPNAASIENLVHYKPWELLILIKWTLLYGDYSSPNRRHVSDRDFDDMRKYVYDLSGKIRMPSQYQNVFLFLRNLAFQQFWLQEHFSGSQIARQSLLFGNIPQDHPFQKVFKSKTNLSIDEFIELSFVLITRIFDKSPVFTAEWFSTIRPSYSEGAIEFFLNCLGKEITFLRKYLSGSHGQPNIAYEFYEQTPLKRYPLLKNNDTYYCYFSNLFFRSMETYVYDTLRDSDSHAFMNKFGAVFEDYIEMGVRYSELPYLDEKVLKKYSNGGKTTDFVLVDQGTNIFIDAKGVEIGYLGMVSHLSEVIKDKTKTSVIKGIRQGYDTARLLQETDEINGVHIGKEDAYLLIITFKDLYIGNGRDFYNYIAKDTIDEIVAEYGEELISPKNMYFISVNDADEFFYCIKNGLAAREILSRSVDADGKPESVKFVFRQHLEEFMPKATRLPHYLEDEYASIIDKLKSRFPKT